jgi:hypothetical protein
MIRFGSDVPSEGLRALPQAAEVGVRLIAGQIIGISISIPSAGY